MTERRNIEDVGYFRDAATSSHSNLTVVLIHGFLDDHSVWDDVVTDLTDSHDVIRFDLAGSGSRGDLHDDLSLERFRDDSLRIIDDIDGPVIVAGQSMGGQVAELIAAARPEQVRGLVLIAPVPLGGTHLPEEAVSPFRALGGDAATQRAVRLQLSPQLDESALDRLTEVGMKVADTVVARYVDIWNNGLDGHGGASAFTGPVLIIRGESDGFVSDELVEGLVRPRFANSTVTAVAGGGHWLHVEQPVVLAEAITTFAASLDSATGWRKGFGDKSEQNFGAAFAENVVLEASVLKAPLSGRHTVATVMQAASSIYERLDFVSQTDSGLVTYLQWTASAFGGVPFSGVTVLTKDDDGLIQHAAIHHRPLGAVLLFSAELRSRLDGVLDTSTFFHDDRVDAKVQGAQ